MCKCALVLQHSHFLFSVVRYTTQCAECSPAALSCHWTWTVTHPVGKISTRPWIVPRQPSRQTRTRLVYVVNLFSCFLFLISLHAIQRNVNVFATISYCKWFSMCINAGVLHTWRSPWWWSQWIWRSGIPTHQLFNIQFPPLPLLLRMWLQTPGWRLPH